MHTFTWSLVSRSARAGSGSRWPGTAVVAAVSSVTSLLRAGYRVAAHLQATYRHPRVPRNTPRRLTVTPSLTVNTHPAVNVMKPGFHHARVVKPGFHHTGSGLLGLPEDLVDLIDLGQQFVGL